MISIICLCWIGFKLNAPIWYFILLSFALVVKLIDLGIKLGEKNK